MDTKQYPVTRTEAEWRKLLTPEQFHMSDANSDQRANLQRTRDAFLRFRDGCPDNACIAETYRGRMREIRDIMLGTWRPGR